MKKILLTLLIVPFLGSLQANAQNCQADFVQDSTACPNVAFIDQSTSTFQIVEWYWDFGDGNTSNAQNGTNTYTTDGNFNVCLTTVSADSCVSTYCSTVNINCIGGGGGGSTCQADFVLDSSVCPNVAFIDQSTTSTSIVEWYWNFGDGNTSNAQNPSHTYSLDGNFNVCLTTVSADSCASTYCSSVDINCLGGGGCSASFTQAAYPDSSGGTALYIVNTSTSSPGTSYSWNFGDGFTSTDQYPVHSYTTDGTFLLCLTISDSLGCSDTFCDSVVVTGSANGFTLYGKSAESASLEDLELYSGLSLYPNPTSHNVSLNINSAEFSEVQVAIVNIAGQIVSQSSHQLNSGDNTLNLYTEELMKGYYFVKITSNDVRNVEAIRFIKN